MTGRPHFVLLGTPVRVEPTFLLVAVWLALGEQRLELMLAWVAVLFVSILLHELGHALAYRYYGSGSAIVLWGFGGLTVGGAALPPRKHVVVSLAGPLSELLLLGLPAWWLDRSDVIVDPTAQRILEMVVFVNVFWAIVNLLPMLPLDGGNIARDLVTITTGRPGERPARYVSIVTAAAAGLYAAVVMEWVFAALFAGVLVVMNVRALRQPAPAFIRVQSPPRRSPRSTPSASVPPGPEALPPPVLLAGGYDALVAGDPAGAERAVAAVLAGDPYRDVERSALELLAWAQLRSGRDADARATLDGLPAGRAASRYLRAAVLAVDGTPAGATALMEAFLFGGAGHDRTQALLVASERGLLDRLVHDLEGAGPDGVARLAAIEQLLGSLGRPADAARVAGRRGTGGGG